MHHQWVKHTMTRVSTLPDIDEPDKVVVIEDPADIAEGEDKAVYGCNVCGVPLEGNADTLCDPVCHCGENLSNHTSEHNFVAMR